MSGKEGSSGGRGRCIDHLRQGTKIMDLHVGAIVDVVVSSVETFGLLVRFQDREGVVLVTNIHWDNDGAQRKMVESLHAGQRLRVKVVGVAPEQFSCSIKHLYPEEDPWWNPDIYIVGSMHEGAVSTVFGGVAAHVRLPSGANVAIDQVKPGTRVGEQIRLKIVSVDVERQRIKGQQID